jgi:hypothetical protein
MGEFIIETVNSVKITVTYDTSRGRGSNDFSTLQDLKKWLDKNPLIADKLGYSKKK